jgi:hypothetical protein
LLALVCDFTGPVAMHQSVVREVNPREAQPDTRTRL